MSLEYLASKTVEHAMKQSGKRPKSMGWHAVFAFVGVILLIIGIGLIVAPAATELDIKPFVNDGVPTDGTIVELEMRRAALGYRGLNKKDEYWVHVMYKSDFLSESEYSAYSALFEEFKKKREDADPFIAGVIPETEAINAQTNLVRKETFDALKEGDRVDIVYLPNDPERIILSSELAFYRIDKTNILPIPGVLLVLAGIVSIGVYILLDRRKKKQSLSSRPE